MDVLLERVRAALVGVVAIALAVGAHLIASGQATTDRLTLGVLAATVAPGVVLLGRRALTPARLLPALVALQIVLHVELAVLMPAHGPAAQLGAAPLGADPHAAHHASPALAAVGPAAPTTLDILPSASMLAAHALALLLTALVLVAGDRAALRLLVWMSAVALLVASAASVPGPAQPTPAHLDEQRAGRRSARLDAGGLRFRGPPSGPPRASARMPALPA